MNPYSISPLDSRYYKYTSIISNIFSDISMVRNRIMVEYDLYVFMVYKIYGPDAQVTEYDPMSFSMDDYIEILDIEKTTKHDIKSIEIYLRRRIDKYPELIHYGITSQDIISISNALAYKAFKESVFDDIYKNSVNKMDAIDKNPMIMGRTHGQPAGAVSVGSQIAVYIYRLVNRYVKLSDSVFAKIGGALGDNRALYFVYPEIDWDDEFSELLKRRYGIERSRYTTQTDYYDSLLDDMHIYSSLCAIYMDICKDMWMYAMSRQIKIKVSDGYVGSSTLAHKVNPIKFENAEGNFKLAIGMFETITRELRQSRLQRDLSDSTIIRNLGAVFSYMIVGISSFTDGITSIEFVDESDSLSSNYQILSEPVQLLARLTDPGIYDKVKLIFRDNPEMNREQFINAISSISPSLSESLKNVTPITYAR